MVYSFDWHPSRPLTAEEIAMNESGEDIHAETIPGTDRTLRNRDNDYLVDRELQRSGASFTGIKGLAMQDSGIQESQGEIHDRSIEHLAGSDLAIVLIRNYLMDTVKRVQAGETPPGTNPASHRIRAVGFTMPADKPLREAPPDLIKATSPAYATLA
jgi:hypothetical protein